MRIRWNRCVAARIALVALLIAGPAAPLALRLWTVVRYRGQVYRLDAAPVRPVAIVFGAGLTPTGAPSAVLYDRVATAAALYRAGRVERLLLSGDNRDASHDEPAAMRRVALDFGVPDSALILDPAGLRTYDTCRRARRVYGVESAVLVTQRFHLPRALLTCEGLGIDAAGVAADRRDYPWRHVVAWQIRETLATVGAWWDVRVRRPEPGGDGRDPVPSPTPRRYAEGCIRWHCRDPDPGSRRTRS